MKRALVSFALGLCALLWDPAGVSAQAVTLRFMCYADGNECDIYRTILDRFEAANPDIRVAIDAVPYNAIREKLLVQLQAGEGPDVARVTDPGDMTAHFLDLRPWLRDAAGWEAAFYKPSLDKMRHNRDPGSIFGFPNQLTLTTAFVNVTLFEQAGVALPPEGATWDDWAAAAAAVQKKLGLYSGMAMDRTCHRFAAAAISQGARYLDPDGTPNLVDAGFRSMAERFVAWHRTRLMPPDLWPSASGSRWKNGGELFENADTAFLMSGSFIIPRFARSIGSDFDWRAIPHPCGPAGCTGIPGGSVLVAIKYTKHPAQVARLMEFLASEENLADFAARTYQLPAHLGLLAKGIRYEGASEPAVAALDVVRQDFRKLMPIAEAFSIHPAVLAMNNTCTKRLSQAASGELPLDKALAKLEEDLAHAVAGFRK